LHKVRLDVIVDGVGVGWSIGRMAVDALQQLTQLGKFSGSHVTSGGSSICAV
jgi:hypothetical protein